MSVKQLITMLLMLAHSLAFGQVELGECPQQIDEKADAQVQKALKELNKKASTTTLRMANIYANNALKFDEENAHALYLLGEIALRERNLLKAEASWTKCLEVCPDYKADLFFFLGIIYLENGKKQQAEELLSKFLANPERERGYDKDAKAALKEIRLKDELMNNPVPFDPKPVRQISTSADEYLAIISPDEELCFFTRRQRKKDKYAGPAGTTRMVEEFTLATKAGSVFTKGEALESPFNENFNEGGASITADNKELFFTVCQVDGDGYQNCDIYTCKKEYGYWGDIKPMNDEVNKPKSWESQPTVSANGDALYFASNREGGQGGLDIWKITRLPNGDWTSPINLGPVINTSKNEKSPFIHSDSQTLYFASDGHPTLGGYDIYLSKQNDETNEWNTPRNIGYPINTAADEIGLFVSLDGSKAYFNSNKLRGAGGWDLYEFALYESARPERVALLKGVLLDENQEVVRDARLEAKNLKTKEITQIKVDELTGEFATVVKLKERENIILKVNKEGSAFNSKFIDANDDEMNGVVNAKLEVKPLEVGKAYRLNDINFATNSYELNENARQIIDEFLLFLEDNPQVKIDIQGHTDDVGNDEDNLILSKNRARVVYAYLVERGIAASRMTHHGYGENQPIATNKTEEGRAKNRRTVFVITAQ
jgi:outer membrane protein OmpA-like peptidoglycan-associated protein